MTSGLRRLPGLRLAFSLVETLANDSEALVGGWENHPTTPELEYVLLAKDPRLALDQQF